MAKENNRIVIPPPSTLPFEPCNPTAGEVLILLAFWNLTRRHQASSHHFVLCDSSSLLTLNAHTLFLSCADIIQGVLSMMFNVVFIVLFHISALCQSCLLKAFQKYICLNWTKCHLPHRKSTVRGNQSESVSKCNKCMNFFNCRWNWCRNVNK